MSMDGCKMSGLHSPRECLPHTIFQWCSSITWLANKRSWYQTKWADSRERDILKHGFPGWSESFWIHFVWPSVDLRYWGAKEDPHFHTSSGESSPPGRTSGDGPAVPNKDSDNDMGGLNTHWHSNKIERDVFRIESFSPDRQLLFSFSWLYTREIQHPNHAEHSRYIEICCSRSRYRHVSDVPFTSRSLCSLFSEVPIMISWIKLSAAFRA
jgi:hypothetical protein